MDTEKQLYSITGFITVHPSSCFFQFQMLLVMNVLVHASLHTCLVQGRYSENFNFLLSVDICLGPHMPHTVGSEVRGHLEKVSFLFTLYGSWGWQSGHRPQWWVPLPAESSHQSRLCVKCYLNICSLQQPFPPNHSLKWLYRFIFFWGGGSSFETGSSCREYYKGCRLRNAQAGGGGGMEFARLIGMPSWMPLCPIIWKFSKLCTLWILWRLTVYAELYGQLHRNKIEQEESDLLLGDQVGRISQQGLSRF